MKEPAILLSLTAMNQHHNTDRKGFRKAQEKNAPRQVTHSRQAIGRLDSGSQNVIVVSSGSKRGILIVITTIGERL